LRINVCSIYQTVPVRCTSKRRYALTITNGVGALHLSLVGFPAEGMAESAATSDRQIVHPTSERSH